MSKRAKWLLILLFGLLAHLNLTTATASSLSIYRNLPSETAWVAFFGQQNFRNANAIAEIESWIFFFLWIVFAYFLVRDANK